MRRSAASNSSQRLSDSCSTKRWLGVKRPCSARRNNNSFSLSLPFASDASFTGSVSPWANDRKMALPLTPSAASLPQFDVATLDHFLNAIGHRTLLAHQALTITRQFPQLSNLWRRNETGLQQTVAQQVRQPLRVFDIGLAPAQSMRMLGIDQDYLQRIFQYVEHRLPVNARALDRYVGAVGRLQPVAQAQQTVSHSREGANLLLPLGPEQTRDQHPGVHVNATTDFINNSHWFSFPPAGRASIKKILLCKFTRARDIIRWYLEKTLGSNYGSGSASRHRHQGVSISRPHSLKVAFYIFQ